MSALKNIFVKLRLNRITIIKYTSIAVGSIYTFWGFVSLFVSTDDFMPNNLHGWQKFICGFIVFLIILLIAYIVSSIRVLISTSTRVLTSNSNNKVTIKYGDLFSSDVVEKGYNGRINVVIPVNRCFDTIVNDSLVSHVTQHGRTMQKLYDEGLFDESSLNKAIQNSLTQTDYIEHLNVDMKPEGNLLRYPCGTVAEVKVSDKLTYFFLGLSKFDEHLKASTTKAEFAEAIQKMIEFCNDRSQGYPVVMPLLGTGLSRTNIPATDVLKYLASAFGMNKDIINCDFYIIVWEGLKDKVSIKNI